MMAGASDSVIALTVTDKAKLQSVIDAHIGSAQVASTDYQGQQIKTIAQPAGMSTSVSYVVTDDALLVAPSVDLIKEALDVKAGHKPALADDSYYLQQLGTLHADRLATLYFNAGQQMAADARGLQLAAARPVHADVRRDGQRQVRGRAAR